MRTELTYLANANYVIEYITQLEGEVAVKNQESVNLRTERVTVERRQPLESTSAPGAGAFEERVVEVRETAEEPVVSKTAHVAEEVVIGRESTERTETVRDTVRREDVEITKGDTKP